MFKKGIVDAAKVTRSALQNAASIAAMVLTTETLITDIPEKQAAGGRRWPRPRRRRTWTSNNPANAQEPGPSARALQFPRIRRRQRRLETTCQIDTQGR